MTKKAANTAMAPAAPNPIPSGMVEVAARFGVDSDDLSVLARIGGDSINRAMFEITRAGLAFMRAQELLSLGQGGDRGNGKVRNSDFENTDGFLAWLEENGLAKQRVYEAMKIAKFVSQLPQKQIEDVLALGKVKVMLLASLPQEVIDRSAESGKSLVDKADMMTVAELKEEVSSLKRREKNYEAELERAQLKIDRLSAGKKRLTEFEQQTEDVRQECMALQLEAELPIQSLQKLFERALSEHLSSPTPESRLRVEQIWVTANIVCSGAMDMLSNLCNLAASTPDGNDLPQRALGTHILSQEEAQNWLLSKGMIQNKHEADKAVRQAARDEAKPKGPGRPSGSKNKKAAE